MIALVATLAGGYPIFKEAVANLVARRMTMELSMTIALAAALAIGEFFTALVIVLFVLIAEVLEGLTVGRGRRAIKDLLDLLPRNAVVRRGEGTQEVGAADIQVGNAIGLVPTIALLLADAILGSMLWRQQGRAAWVRFNRALAEGRIAASDRVVLFNCGTALKYPMPAMERLLDTSGPVDYTVLARG